MLPITRLLPRLSNIRFAFRPLTDTRSVSVNKLAKINGFMVQKKFVHNFPLTYDFARERIMLVLRLFDKIDPEKLTLDSHFIDDLGLDSLDHVEIIMEMEDEFLFEIPDQDAEKLLRPRDILRYITDHEEAYEELQKLQAHDHHGHGHGHGHDHHIEAGHGHGSHNEHPATGMSGHPTTQTRTFCSWTAKRYFTEGGEPPKGVYNTSFGTYPKEPVNFEDIQQRVMKVCSKYDKIDSTKLNEASHFVEDLGLDSLDHVEIMMELEDEFGLEIPDQDAEKLLRPSEIARYIMQKEEKRSVNPPERNY